MEEQKKKSLKEKLLQFKQNTFAFFKKSFLKLKQLSIFVYQKIRKGVLFLWKKLKHYSKIIAVKIKHYFKLMIIKIKKFTKPVIIKIKGLNLYFKVIFISILVLSIIGTSLGIVLNNQKVKNLSTYNLLNEVLVHQNLFELDSDFFEIEDVLIPDHRLQELDKYHTFYQAMKNNYNYYYDLLKTVKRPNDNMRLYINNQLSIIEEKSILVNNYNNTIFLELAKPLPDIALLDTVTYNLEVVLHTIVTTSLNLIPQIENYIILYGNENIQNKLQVYLTKLQFHYTSSIYEMISIGQYPINQLNDLKNIILKNKDFLGTSTNVYAQDFILAYENFNAYNYYRANDKFIFISSSSLSTQEKAYSQAFYNFLMQANYN